jgi:outer membrane protein OmpA-like peptidoglycan-associated protein
MRKFFLLLFLLTLFQNCFAQQPYTTEKTAKKKILEDFRKGQRLMFNNQLNAAAEVLEKVLKSDPTFIDAQIEWANLKNQQGKLAEAELGYEKALAIDPAYEVNVLYSLAIVEFEQKKFEESAGHFEQFLNTPGKVRPERKERAAQYLVNIRFAAEAVKNPVPFQPQKLPENINTAKSEYFPTLTANGKNLIFTRFDGWQEDFYRSRLVNGEWQPAEPIAGVNTPENEGSQSISADGKLLVFTGCNRKGGMGSCDLYYTELVKGQWTPVKNLGAPVNSALWESQPSLSADGKSLYFCRGQKHGDGDVDIYVSYRQPNGSWSEPKSIGPVINTPEKDVFPFIHPDGKTLYFVSEGHPGMGASDIYLSRLQPDGSWGKPVNLGYPINTEGFESSIFISLDGKTGYLASDILSYTDEKKLPSRRTTDIYSFELYDEIRPSPVTYVEANIVDAVTGKPIAARVEFTDVASGQLFAASDTEDDGVFLVTLPAGKDYALNVSKEKYLFYSENFALAQTGTFEQPYLLEIALTPIPDGMAGTGDLAKAKPIVLKNVFFETGSAALKKESRTELNRLKKLLNDNPSLKIQINGHTDDVGSEADNLKLSGDRAKAVYSFLIENGIDAKRLKFKGFGETLPVASNDTEAGRQQNRRTEFVIIE